MGERRDLIMNILLLITTHMCVIMMTACIVSLYYDYKSGNRKVCKTVKAIKRTAIKALNGILRGIGYIILTAPLVIWFVYSYATM
jgi:uncharacterized membrane protein YukC